MRCSIFTRAAVAVVAALAFGGLAAPQATASTSGWNDWGCKPGTAHPTPVVLVHGLGASDVADMTVIATNLSSKGYCVFSETYGTTYYSALVGGLASMRDSAAQLGRFVDKVIGSTGVAKVDIVGHSEGTTVPAYYMKKLGGAAKVGKFVGFGSNFHGTTLYGLQALAKGLGLNDLLSGGGCPACTEYQPGSDFIAELTAGGVTVPGPTYTSIMTKLDEVVLPYTSGKLDGPGTFKNIVLQDICGLDLSGHLGLTIDPNVLSQIRIALDPDHAEKFLCLPYASPIG